MHHSPLKVLLPALLLASSPIRSTAQDISRGLVSPPQIAVSATGEVRVQPDRATIAFAVETRASTAAGAAAENARRQKAVSDALRAKISNQDRLATAGYSVSTDDRYDSGQRKVVGYVARNTVVLETQSIEKVGSLIDVALASGSNLVSGLRFWSSQVDRARRDALAQAVSNARSDAEVMAKAAGGSLGSLLEMQSSSPGGPIVMEAMAMRAASAETPITPSEQTVSATVSARWTFIPAKN